MYEFRLYTLSTHLILWTTSGLVVAALVSRLLDGKRQTVGASLTTSLTSPG